MRALKNEPHLVAELILPGYEIVIWIIWTLYPKWSFLIRP